MGVGLLHIKEEGRGLTLHDGGRVCSRVIVSARGNRHPEGAGRVGTEHCSAALQRLSETGVHCHPYRFAVGVVGHEPVVTGFCLSHRRGVVGVCGSRHSGCWYSVRHGFVPVDQSGFDESGEIPEI